jgi:hypothetical protein
MKIIVKDLTYSAGSCINLKSWITETWLTESVSINEIFPTNFLVYRRGGGVLIAISVDIPSKLHFISSNIEFIAVQLLLHPPILLCCMYLPPGNLSNSEICSNVYSTLCSLPVDQEIILLGDFNLPGINWSSFTGLTSLDSYFCDLLVNLNFLQLVEASTHKKGGVLDLILTNSAHRISNVFVDNQICYQHSDDYFNHM